jgi:hypothetical protein
MSRHVFASFQIGSGGEKMAIVFIVIALGAALAYAALRWHHREHDRMVRLAADVGYELPED